MPHYRITLESKEEGLHYVNANDCQNVNHACSLCRKHFSFDEWRIINIAESVTKLVD